MVCSNCGAENREGRKFCSQCAARLALACPSCGASNEPGERFCGECAAALEDPAASGAPATQPTPKAEVPAAERRLVSVLFADLVGFTTLSEHRDPEEVRELLSRYFDTAREVISRYGGVVEKFIGDAVMAVWGTPVAHEDDAERAVRAALELVDAISALGVSAGAPDLRLRAGVLTGEAAVTIGAEGEGMVAGDLVNTAARLQSAATPGTVLVGRSTYLAANNAIAFEPAGEHTLKGKELPVEAWRATRVVAGARGFGRAERLEAPFVGRDQELRQLKDLLHRTGREKRPRLVSIMGVGGIGKSRLAWEFFKYVDGLVETTYWHQGRSPAYGEGVTFWALGEMVRMRCRIAENEDDRSSREKLDATLREYVSDPEERRWIEPRLAHLLGLEATAPGEREDLFAAWRTFFERISRKGTTVLVFEDLHWSDPGLIDFIEHTLEWARSHPILIVTLARPELLEKRPNWGAGQRNFVSMYLEPLGADAMRELLVGLACDLPEDAVRQILERAEGVPLYAVEMVRMLIDQGRLVAQDGSFRLSGELERLDVPQTLHGLIASRLDVLASDERVILHDASVLGKTFTLQALAAVARDGSPDLERRLKDLVRKEILVFDADPRSPERGQYGFIQSLIREVAYQTLSKKDRLSRHLAAAQHFETSGEDELASVVATHYLEAYRAAPGGPQAEELAAKARRALLSAAQRASSLGAHEQALSHVEQALTVTTDDTERAALWEKAAESAIAAALPVAKSYLTQVIDWHEQRGDRSAAARATAHLGLVLAGGGELESAIQLLEDAFTQLSDLDDDPATAELMAARAGAYMFVAPTRAIEWADKALVAAERLDLVPTIIDALIFKSTAVVALGRLRETVAGLTGALALAEQHGLFLQQARALANLSDVLLIDSPRRAAAAARRGLGIARKLGVRDPELTCAINGCWAAVSTGEWDAAETTISESRSDDLPLVLRVWFGSIHSMLKTCRGDLNAARQELQIIQPLVQQSTDPQEHGIFREAQGWIELVTAAFEGHDQKAPAAGDGSQSVSDVHSCVLAVRRALWLGKRDEVASTLRRLDESNLHGDWLDCMRRSLHAGLFVLDGRLDEGISLYRQAAQTWRHLEVPFDLALSQLDFATLVRADHPDARAAADEAREVFSRLGAKPFLARLDAALRTPQPV